jgi:hypothetical protein
MRRPLMLLMSAATATVAVAGIGVSAAPALASRSAPADTIIKLTYPVTGNTLIKKINSTIALGPGTLATSADLTTSTLTAATLTLPPATGSFKELGFITVTATTKLIQVGQATGTFNFNANTVTTTATAVLQLTSLNIAGLNIPVGSSCETSPASITVSSQPGFTFGLGGNLAGTYTIPNFHHCGLATLLINLTLPGSGNTITLTLGKPTLG